MFVWVFTGFPLANSSKSALTVVVAEIDKSSPLLSMLTWSVGEFRVN